MGWGGEEWGGGGGYNTGLCECVRVFVGGQGGRGGGSGEDKTLVCVNVCMCW